MSYILYDVALSFAGEDRDYVAQVANLLRLNGVRVFYDEYERANLWGKELIEYLEDVYKNKSNYVIIFVSKSYLVKDWTNHERKSALNRAFRSKREYILPIKLDDTSLPGLHDSIGYLSGKNLTPAHICDIFLEKVGIKKNFNIQSFLLLYGIRRSKYAKDISGFGNSILGSRWNSKGNKILYTSPSVALATLDVAVHAPLTNNFNDYRLIQYLIPANLPIKNIYESDLPKDWNQIPYAEITQKIGDKWIQDEETCILSVPSTIVAQERNYLLNPNHKDFNELKINKIEEFTFDERLGRRL